MSLPPNYKGSVPPRLMCGFDTNDSLLHEARINEDGFIYTISHDECIGMGCLPTKTAWAKIGYNPSVGTAEELVWPVGGAYVWPSVAMSMEVTSDNGADDMGSTGIEKVKIYYLDDDYNPKTEIVEMNGTGVVQTTATDIFRVQNFRAHQVGTGGVAAGNIVLRHTDNTPTYSRISAGYTRGRNLIYTVPLGYYLFITSITLSVNGANKGIRVTTRADYEEKLGAIQTFFTPYTEFAVPNCFAYRPLESPTRFPEKTRIMVVAASDQDGAILSVALRGWLEPA